MIGTRSRIEPDRIPSELKTRLQWLCWKYIDGDRKLPINPQTLQAGKSNDPQTWTDFQTALDVFNDNDSLAGIAFVLSAGDMFFGIDLDDCINDRGEVSEVAQSIVNEFDSYVERSPSGTGIKLIAKGVKPLESRCTYNEPAKIEIYDRGRFWTITTETLDGFDCAISDRQSELLKLIKWLNEKNGVSAPTPAATEPAIGNGRFADAQNYIAKCGQASEPGRNNAAFNIAGHLYSFDLGENEVFELLSGWDQQNDSPLGPREIKSVVKSARINGTPRAPKTKRLPSNINVDIVASPPSVESDWFDISLPRCRTDNANSRYFVDLYGDRLRYVPFWNKWLTWTGKKWLDDNNTTVLFLAKKYAESLWVDFRMALDQLDPDDLKPIRSFVKSTNGKNGINALVELAKCDPRIVCQVAELNANPYLLNLDNGTFNLKTDTLQDHNPDDYLTQIANVAYDPDADCPGWRETMTLIFDNDNQLIRYVQKAVGFSLSGLTDEHAIFICNGPGENGKSTFWNPLHEILGDYSYLADDNLIVGKDEHPANKAALYGKRFVCLPEPPQNGRIKESQLKQLTGDDIVNCRGMRENFWEYKRTHTLWLSTNHRLRISGTDHGIWRRIKEIPFSVRISDKVAVKKDMSKILVAQESSGILKWALDGFAVYLSQGLNEPDAVKNATADYRKDQDEIAQFIEQICVENPACKTPATVLFSVYKDWGGSRNKNVFGSEISERFERKRQNDEEGKKRTFYLGIGLEDTPGHTQTVNP